LLIGGAEARPTEASEQHWSQIGSEWLAQFGGRAIPVYNLPHGFHAMVDWRDSAAIG
jgi:hypothetical protein